MNRNLQHSRLACVAFTIALASSWFLFESPAAASRSRDALNRKYVIIAHPDTEVPTLSRRDLGRMFLKKKTRWPDGTLISPVDLPADAKAREGFTREVLGRTIRAVRSYWQQCIFSGRAVPPPELDNGEKVVEYVLRVQGAVGYVPITTRVKSAKVVRLQ